MKTLSTLIAENPNVLFKCTDDLGIDYKYHYTKENRAIMYDGSDHALNEAKWQLYVMPLELQIIMKCYEIDIKTATIIFQGFYFNGELFSLSERAQANWNSVSNRYNRGRLSLPHEISKKDGDEYFLTPDNIDDFFDQAFKAGDTTVTSGRALRKQARQATTIDELNNVIDNRPIQPFPEEN